MKWAAGAKNESRKLKVKEGKGKRGARKKNKEKIKTRPS
jgi:hypothetical protein